MQAIAQYSGPHVSEPAELALRDALDRVTATVATALGSGKPKQAIDAIATIPADDLEVLRRSPWSSCRTKDSSGRGSSC